MLGGSGRLRRLPPPLRQPPLPPDCVPQVFGLASWMLFHGPLGPALSFLVRFFPLVMHCPALHCMARRQRPLPPPSPPRPTLAPLASVRAAAGLASLAAW